MQQNSALFDHFIGARQQVWRHIETERARRLQIEREFELGRLQDWKLARLSGPRQGARRRYSITSSAATSILGGTSRSRVFAVLRLMTNSNLVGCITGRSVGSPLRILPT